MRITFMYKYLHTMQECPYVNNNHTYSTCVYLINSHNDPGLMMAFVRVHLGLFCSHRIFTLCLSGY